jgi:hypothetical protein
VLVTFVARVLSVIISVLSVIYPFPLIITHFGEVYGKSNWGLINFGVGLFFFVVSCRIEVIALHLCG